MNRVAGLVLAGLVLLLNVTLTQAQDRCPVDGAEPSVLVTLNAIAFIAVV